MNIKIIILLINILILFSCSQQKKSHSYIECVKETNSLDILVKQFSNKIEPLWGTNEVLLAGPKDYVKYNDNFHTRSHINFESGQITIETISVSEPIVNLRNAIIKILSISSNPNNEIHYLSEVIYFDTNQEPLLYGQILDSNNHSIRWKRQAENFADYLIQNKLQKRISGLHVIWSIIIPMISNHIDKRADKYLSAVYKTAKKYGVDASLILAIIQTESSFNPYAISDSNALGLMQIVQYTAGIDVFRIKGKWGEPNRTLLLDPQNNIDIGTNYLFLLQNTYLEEIIDPLSRLYAVIIAYNSGVDSLLHIFANEKEHAFKIINNMSSIQFYKVLISNHPSVKARHYLYKVKNIRDRYHYF